MIRQVFFYILGLIVLCLNKIRYSLAGYTRPRDFPVAAINRALAYDFSVVDSWQTYLQKYTGRTIHSASILEFGPGADLGVALILLSRGAKKYCAFDINNLISGVPVQLYNTLAEQLKQPELLSALHDATKIRYVWDATFNLERLAGEQYDIIFSQAAFEHFTDPKKTLEQLNVVAKPGTVLLAEIDLQTHTRWLRTHDPLNIYRYSEKLYRAVHFSGIPNRLRPQAYQKILEHNQWENIQVFPKNTLSAEAVQLTQPWLAQPFQSIAADMAVVSFILCATKK